MLTEISRNKIKYITFYVIVLMLVAAITYAIQRSHDTGARSTRLACQEEVVVFEKTYHHSFLKRVQNRLKHGNFELNATIRPSHYMPSKLFDSVDIEKVDQMVRDAIFHYKNKEEKEYAPVVLDYYIYENDKEDPGKKTAKSKLYAGYLKFEVKYEGKTVYAVQIDFIDLQGKDIPQRVRCAVESIMTAS